MANDEYNQRSQNGQPNKKKVNSMQDHRLDGHEPNVFVEMTKSEKREPGILVDMSEPDKYEHAVFVEKSTSQDIKKSEPMALKSASQDIKKSEQSTPKSVSQDTKKSGDKPSKLNTQAEDRSYFKELDEHVKNLGSTIEQLAAELKKSTDAKSWEALSQGNLDIRRYANYYDVSNTIETADATDPNDFDSPVYNVERVFEYLERYAEIMYVANDGTDNLYVIVSHGGRTRFSQEAPVYPGEVKCYFNVYELRLRSPTAGLPYRVTEYCINNISEISSIPIEKANLHNQALPAAGFDWLVTSLSPTSYPTTFEIDVAVSIVGIFSVEVTKGGVPTVISLNNNVALTAGALNHFYIKVHNGDTINFQYSTTTGTIQILRVQEFDSASA